MKTKDFISLILIGLLMMTSCDSNGQAKKKLTPEQLKAKNQARLDSLNKVNNDAFMQTDALYKKMAGTWVFKQMQSCDLGNCIFYGTNANGICDKLKITLTHEVGALNGGYYANNKYLVYHLRLAVKDGIILDDKEIGDGSTCVCVKNSGLFEQVQSYDKKTTFIRCGGSTVRALYNECFKWDAAKEAFYSDYSYNICGKECHISGYWQREN